MDVAGVSTDKSAQKDIGEQVDKVSGEVATGKGLGKIAAAVKNNSNAVKVGKLYNAVQTANRVNNSKANQSDIVKSLTRKGFTTETATDIAGALVAAYNGQTLTKVQSKLMESAKDSKAVQEAVEKIVKNAASTMGQREQSVQALMKDANLANIAKAANISVEQLKQIYEKAQSGTLTKEDLVSAETTYNVSTDGKTIYQGDVVAVKEIASIKDGKMTLRLENGAEVDSRSVSYGTEAEALVYEVVAGMGVDVKTANSLVEGFQIQNSSNLQAAADYAHGISTAFRYGMYNYSMDELSDTDAAKLSKPVRELAYNQGQKVAGKQVAKEQARINAVYEQAKATLEQQGITAGEHSVKLAEGISKEQMSKSQRASYDLAEQIAPAISGDILVYEGKQEWGYYDHKTDTICLNVNARWSRVSMMTFTLAHELVHRAKLGSPAKFKAFANFLVKEYGKQGSNLDAMIGEQLAAAKKAGIKMDPDQAFEEIICDACQKMLVDTDAGKKLAEFGAQSVQNRNIVEQFGQWLKELLNKLRSIFRNVEPDSLAAKEFQKFDAKVKQILADMFVDMSLDAGEKLSTIKAAGMTEKITTDNGGYKHKLNVNAASELNKALYDKNYDNEVLLRDETPAIMLSQKGVRNLPMAMNASHIRENVFTEAEARQLGLPVNSKTHYHGLGEAFFLQIIDGLDNVKEAYRGTKYASNPARRENYFLLISEFADKKGNTINVPVYIDEHAQCNKVFIDVNKISTAFGRDNFRAYINKQVSDKNLIRIKNRSNQSSEHHALIAERYGEDASMDSIRSSKQNVNQNQQDNKKSFKMPVAGAKSKIGVMTEADIQAVQSIGRISVNQFSAADIKATERFAQQYWKEMGVKSPFFRAWFGDWRTNDQTKVQVATQKGDTRGVQKNNDTGWDIQVSGKVFNETTSHNKSFNKAAVPYLPYINDIVRRAVLLDSSGIDVGRAKSNNSLLMHSLYAVADIGNGLEIIKLYVEEMNNPNAENTGKRAYQLQNIEKYHFATKSSQNTASSRSVASGTVDTVADLFAAVKQKDSSFRPKPASKVVNPDGTPMVVYHGTSDQFTEFKHSELSDKEGSFFFAQNREDAEAYTGNGNVMAVYVNLQNPIDYNDMPSEIYKLKDKKAQVAALRKLGYDGWMCDMDTGWGEVSAFNSNQIKSTTDNIGTFDGSNPDIRYKLPVEEKGSQTSSQSKPYSYDTLVGKPDMKIVEVGGAIPSSRADIVAQAKKNAAKIGKVDPKTGNVSVRIEDIEMDVFLGRDGLRHSIDRRFNVNAPVILKAGEILSNSIRINELIPKKQKATKSYVLIGAARNDSGEMFVVRSIVNRFSHNLTSMDVLYAINAKKEPAALLPLSTVKTALGTDSTISISDLLDYVKEYFPDILPEDVLKYYGFDSRPEGDLSKDALYKLPVAEETSPRSLLANALESTVSNEIERNKIAEYKASLEAMEAEEAKLRELNAQIKELSFAKGKRDMEKIRKLRDDARKTTNRINIYDKQLLGLEAAEPLQKVLERERKRAYDRAKQKNKEAMARARETASMREAAKKRRARGSPLCSL